MKKIKPYGSKTLYPSNTPQRAAASLRAGVGGIYEVDKASGGSVTRTVTYYPVAGAMRVDGTLYYMLKDHLGSASVLTNASGNAVSGADVRYYPFGEARSGTGSMLTDKLFTGQREMAGLGIYHYQARFYSPKLGRFLSADTIVPRYANPQHLNRFGYVTNNPLRYTDPSGNVPIDCLGGDGYCEGTPAPAPVSLPIPIPIPEPEFPTEPMPFIDLGPILIPPITLPSSPLEEEPAYCFLFRNEYKALLDEALNIYNEIMVLRKELENPNLDPITRKAIEQRLINLRSRLTDLRQDLEDLKDLAARYGCSIT